MTYIYYTDDLALTAGNIKKTNFLLQRLEEISREIRIMINNENREYMSLNHLVLTK